jgi:hypothetical protein
MSPRNETESAELYVEDENDLKQTSASGLLEQVDKTLPESDY